MMHMHHDSASATCVSTTLRKASRAVARAFDDALAPAGMTTAQFSMLRALRRAQPDGTPLSRLAEAQVMDRTSLYRALAPLTKAGWVEVAASARGRTKVARLTELGEDALGAGEAHWQIAQNRMLDSYGSDRWAVARDILTDLTEIGLSLREP